MQPFMAMIIPMGDSPGFPTHPIAPGGPPPQIWPSPGRPDQSLPGNQPYPDQGLPGPQPIPSHPIVIPPGALGPGVPTHPIVIVPPIASTGPGFPTNPIVIPPGSIGPGLPSHPITLPGIDNTLPGAQPGIDNTLPGAQPIPSHPIVLPPAPPIGAEDKALVFVKTAGQDGVWFILDKNSALKPGGMPQPKK